MVRTGWDSTGCGNRRGALQGGFQPGRIRIFFTVLVGVLTAMSLPAADGANWPSEVVPPASNPAYAGGAEKPPKTTWPPAGKPQRVNFTEDDWFSACPGETMGNAGKAAQLKLKSQQEFFVFKAETAALKGKVITGALLHTRASDPKWPFRRVGVSTIASPWTEGTATEPYKAVEGAPCFLQAEYKKRDWSFPGSTIMDVVMGRGCTLWGFADCTPPDAQNWQAVAVDPRVVRANVADVSNGYFVYDETGCEWSDTGNKFTWSVYPNRFCFSTQQNKNDEPWLEVWVDGNDTAAPAAVSQFKVSTEGLPAGEALVRWIVPEDNKGGAGVTGFQVEYYDKPGNKQIMPRYLVPMAGPAGSECQLHIQDFPFKAGQTINLVIRALDGAGNDSPPFSHDVTLSSSPRVFPFGKEPAQPFPASTTLPKAGAVEVAVVDALDKIDPVSGEMVPAEPKGYLGGNHLFSGAQKRVRLQAGRNEAVDCQVMFHGQAPAIQVEYKFEGEDKIETSVQEFAYVQAGKRTLPDPLVACDGTVAIPSKAGEVHPQGQQWHAVILEAWVPHKAVAGAKKGTITITVGAEKLVLNVDLTVWDFTLPDTLSFVPEMNSYTTDLSPAQWHRLAHDHRTVINQLPYSWSGKVGLPLAFDGTDFGWALFDERVGPMFDGSMFKGCHRDSEPVPLIYLPFNENWPVSLIGHFKGSFWADEAFDEAYMTGMKKAYAAFAKHADAKGWHATFFEFFFNNKVYYRAESGNTRTVVAPWIFDEPTCTQDFWALHWYGQLFHEAVDPVRGKAKMIFRGDVSYSQFGRDLSWGVMDWECLGGGSDEKARQKRDQFQLWGPGYFSEYGAANKVEDANVQPVAWCLTSWARGSSGVLPWLTYGSAKSWQEADQTCLFYEQQKGATAAPSIRLKAFMQGEQLVEYMTLLSDANQVPRMAVAEGMQQAIDLNSKVVKLNETDAGTIEFNGASPLALWDLKIRVGTMLNAKHPAFKKALVDWAMPATDMKRLPDMGYVPVAPEVPSYKPAADTFTIR